MRRAAATGDPPGGVDRSACVRQAVYGGEVRRLAAGAASVALVAHVRRHLRRVLADVGAPRTAQFRLTGDEMHARVTAVRQWLLHDVRARALFLACMEAHGFDPAAHRVDRIRFRAMLHEGHMIPAAAPVYAAHRDTWYANPRAQINWWIPLHRVSEEETFVFYPDAFHRAVANTSALFDYATWKATVGFQNPRPPAEAVYPGALDVPFRAVGFSCRMGEVVLFSGGHLHQTRPHACGATRFSLDVRVVHADDHRRGWGAPDPDNASQGSTFDDYLERSRTVIPATEASSTVLFRGAPGS